MVYTAVAYTGPSAPSGAVTIQVDSGSTLPASCVGATSPLSCTVSYATGSLAAAGHTITASLASDTNYIAASNTGTLTINQATPGYHGLSWLTDPPSDNPR